MIRAFNVLKPQDKSAIGEGICVMSVKKHDERETFSFNAENVE